MESEDRHIQCQLSRPYSLVPKILIEEDTEAWFADGNPFSLEETDAVLNRIHNRRNHMKPSCGSFYETMPIQ